jgi:acetaldehyde dehydrogenase (acetylating)
MDEKALSSMSVKEAKTLIDKARKAQLQFAGFSQEEVDEVVRCIAEIAGRESERLARMAVEETGFGVYEHKVVKNLFASSIVYESIKDIRTVGLINEDKAGKTLEIATPIGVIAALVPCTNPTSTVIFKTLIAVKSGNSIVFSPHPSAVGCIMETVSVLKDIAHKVGAPEDLISCMSISAPEGTMELMKLSSLILATGGSAMVKAAYSSGVPALGVGPGNTPAFIERSADIPIAVKRIISGKTFDNGTICSSEQSIITEECIKDAVRKELVYQGAYFVEGEDMDCLSRLIQKPEGGLNPRVVGQPAPKLAEMAGIKIPYGTRVLVCDQAGVGKDYPFSMEKLSPILAFYSEENWQKACGRCMELLKYGGMGHTVVIHSNNEKVIREFALREPVSRVLVNTPSSLGAIGATTDLVPSLTLGCGASGGSATSDNVSVKHLINIRRVAYGVKEAEDLVPKQSKKIPDIDINKITSLVLERLRELNKMYELKEGI